MKITAREFREKPLPAKSTTKSIPVASPPRRLTVNRNKGTTNRGQQVTDVVDDDFEDFNRFDVDRSGELRTNTLNY